MKQKVDDDICRHLDELKVEIRKLGKNSALKRIGQLETALKVIDTWATFDGGSVLDPKDVHELIQKTL
jgi:hypothetical protein